MTRAEYEAKYGVAPVTPGIAPKVDVAPAPVKMTRAEYDMKYGEKSGKVFGNPLETIQQAGSDVYSAITGTDKYAGKNPVERGFNAAGSTAMTIPGVVADVIPGGKVVSEALGKATGKVIDIFGNSSGYLADAAEKAGIMTPEQRKKYDENNALFANSPEGVAIESGASIGKSSGDIANVILMAHGTAKGTQDFIDNKVPAIKAQVEKANAQWTDARQLDAINKTAQEIAQVEGKYVKGRKAEEYSKDAGFSSRQRIAQSGVLKHTVDENGLIRTKTPGGAVEQYKAMTIKPVEDVVRLNLEREGGKTNLSVVQRGLNDAVMKSGLQGADLQTALNGVKKEIAGLRLRADELGYVDNTLLHDAKINTTSNINYQTPPETAKYRKSVARGYKKLIETNSNLPIENINAQLAPLYEDLVRLESLDGLRVSGGKLGKYTAQISGNIVGGAFGSLVGGPLGMAIGTIVGGETAGLVKGKSMGKTFTRNTGAPAEMSDVLKNAVKEGNSPRLALPAPTSVFKKTVVGGKTINLPSRSQSTIDAMERARRSNGIKTSVSLPVIDSVNPTGSVFSKYEPRLRTDAQLADNITTYDITSGKSPNDLVTIYRGAPKSQASIVPGDFITTNKQLAQDYAGTGHVISQKVPASHILDDKLEPLMEEYIYKP